MNGMNGGEISCGRTKLWPIFNSGETLIDLLIRTSVFQSRAFVLDTAYLAHKAYEPKEKANVEWNSLHRNA